MLEACREVVSCSSCLSYDRLPLNICVCFFVAAFGQQKVQMVFVTIRDEFLPESAEHMTVMAKNYQAMMAAGGLHIGIVGTERNQMVAVANTIRELIEVRKFATNQEEVLFIEYDKSKFVGNHVTPEERVKHDLPAEKKEEDDDMNDEL